jgi:hypothetical protein
MGRSKVSGADHLHGVADLRHVQQRGHARCHVLAVRSGREQQVAVLAGDGQHLRGDVLAQLLGQVGGVGEQHLGHAGHLGGGLCGAGRISAGDQHVDIAAALQGRGDGVEGGALEGAVVVFGNDEDTHVRSPSLRS